MELGLPTSENENTRQSHSGGLVEVCDAHTQTYVCIYTHKANFQPNILTQRSQPSIWYEATCRIYIKFCLSIVMMGH